MSEAQDNNKALARHFLEAVWKQGDLDVVDEILAPDFVDRSLLPGQGSSREEYKRSAAEFYAAFSMPDFTIEDQIDRRGRQGGHQVFDEVHPTG